MAEFIGKRVVPAHAGAWSSEKEYEPLMVVLYASTGDSYMSKKTVPAGTAITDDNYWALCANYSAQMQILEDTLAEDVESMEKTVSDAVDEVTEALSDTQTAIDKQLAATLESVEESLTETTEELTEKVEDAVELTESTASDLEERMDTIEARQDAITTASTEEDSDFATEVVDARVAYGGDTYDSLGGHIRALDQDIEAVRDYDRTIFADGDWEDITDSCGVTDGWYYPDGTYAGTDISGCQCTELISVGSGELYRVSGYSDTNLYGVLLYKDEEDTDPVSHFDIDVAATAFSDFDVIVPAGYTLMRVQTRYYEKQPVVVKKYVVSDIYRFANNPVSIKEILDAVQEEISETEESIDELNDSITEAAENIGGMDEETMFADGEWEDITDSCGVADGWYNYNGTFAGTDISGTQCTEMVSVVPGEIYRVSGYNLQNLRGVFFYTDEDDTEPVSYFSADDGNTVFIDFDVMVPSGCSYMRVQTYNYGTQPIVVKKFLPSELYQYKNIPIALRESIDEADERLDEAEERLEQAEENIGAVDYDVIFADGEWEDITDSCEVADGWYYSYGTFFGTTLEGCQCTGLIPVVSGEIYRLSGYKDTNLYGILLYKSEDDTDPMSYFNAEDVETSTCRFADFELIIPVGYVYMRVQTRNYVTQPIVVKKFTASELYKYVNTPIALRESIEAVEESVEEIEGTVSDIQDSIDESTDSGEYGKWLAYNTMLQIQGATRNRDYEFDDMDTGLVVIVIDDLRHDMDLVASIIVGEYGFPLCVAAIPGNLGNSVDGIEDEDSRIGDTTQGICDYVIESGGEILSHYGSVLTQERAYDEDFLKTYFEKTKNTLYNAGFTKVNGIIMAGGTDELYGKNDGSGNMDKYVRMFYQYSDHCGKMEPYEHARKSMVTALDTFKSYVDSVVTNKSWFATFFHTIDGTEGTSVFDDGFQEAELRERLDYIKEYVDAGTLEVVTYYDIYNTYGHYA